MATSRILTLANAINKSTVIIHDHLVSKNIPFPSFSPDVTTPLPGDLTEARDAVLDAASELIDLLIPPLSALHINGSVSQNMLLWGLHMFSYNLLGTKPRQHECRPPI